MKPQPPGLARPFSTYSIENATRSALVNQGVRTSHDILGLAVDSNDAQKVAKLSINGFASTSALVALQVARAARSENRAVAITCSSKSVDAILGGGGFTIGHVTELCGPPALGKSQFSMQLCVNVQLAVIEGGANGEAVYIDTEGSFSVERVAAMAEAVIKVRSAKNSESSEISDDEKLDVMLSRIHVYRIHNHLDQVKLLEQLEEVVKMNPRIKLIVLDSIAFHLRQGFDDMALRTRILTGSAQILRQIAGLGICVIVVNQMTTRILKVGNQDVSTLVPALGE
ncbi:DNA repair protein rad51c [Physocladia obscura]|uniref:DNA repair protein RAD51 homolog 3 n=1 Tax=Physocladia obscura TaxID=109957 RepID=A0AAD5SQC0_9FUNG|nr:DNA repair protein rad51c [Physocladia obscura]